MFFVTGASSAGVERRACAAAPIRSLTTTPPAATGADTASAKKDGATAPADALPAPTDAGVGEIIVTAQRRSESLTAVPLSIAALSGATLQATGIKTMTDLRFTTPGLHHVDAGRDHQIYIRGIGNAVYVGADPSVATFIDDVPRVYATLVDNLINIDRVEILKGAQGGLYGRNATGGVVNILTRQPADDAAMQARISAASRDTLDASAYLNVPLSNRVAMNFSVARKYRDPYIENIAKFDLTRQRHRGISRQTPWSGLRLSDENLWFVDGKIRLKLTESLKITLAGDYTVKRDGNGNGLVPYNRHILYGTYSAAPLCWRDADLRAISRAQKKWQKLSGDRFVFERRRLWWNGQDGGRLAGFDLTSITLCAGTETASWVTSAR